MKIQNLIKIFVIMIVLNSITGCKADSSITVYTSQDKQVARITDKDQLAELLRLWKQREVVFVKKMPDFNYKLIIVEKGHSSEWKYSVNGYVASTKKADNNIYKVKFSSINLVLRK